MMKPSLSLERDEHDPGGRVLSLPADVRATAIYGGERRQYRYWLEWIWNPSGRTLAACLMNPSTASEREAMR